MIQYRTGNELDLDQVIDLYRASTLGERRPIEDRKRFAAMVKNANLVINSTITTNDNVSQLKAEALTVRALMHFELVRNFASPYTADPTKAGIPIVLNFDQNSLPARNTIKEIFLDKKLVCIAQGKFSIEKFVVFDASLSTELLNQLFMIGFNRFFE